MTVTENAAGDKAPSPYMRPAEAAKYVRLSVATLAQMRVEQRGPRYYKAGVKVLYKMEDLTAWVERVQYQGTAKVVPPQKQG